MGKRTQFVRLLDDIEAAIEVATASGKGQHLRRRPLLRELLEWAVLCRPAADVSLLRKGFPARMRDMNPRAGRVACAIHAVHRYGLSPAKAARLATIARARVTVADLRAVERLAKVASVSLRDLDRNVDDFVRAAVDAHFERLEVVLERRAVEDMLLAALEAYAVPRPGKGQKYTEVFGYCFGTRRDLLPNGSNRRFRRILAVSRVVTQLRGRATANEVFPSDKSEQVHLGIASSFFEHLALVGDYHTHPWRSLQKMRRASGWEFSRADESHVAGWAPKVRDAGGYPRFSLVAAIAKGEKSGRSAVREARNRVRFCVQGLYVVLAAYRLQRDDTYDREVTLVCPGFSDLVATA